MDKREEFEDGNRTDPDDSVETSGSRYLEMYPSLFNSMSL